MRKDLQEKSSKMFISTGVIVFINMIGAALMVFFDNSTDSIIYGFISYFILLTICAKSRLFSIFVLGLFGLPQILDKFDRLNADSFMGKSAAVYNEQFASVIVLLVLCIFHIITKENKRRADNELPSKRTISDYTSHSNRYSSDYSSSYADNYLSTYDNNYASAYDDYYGYSSNDDSDYNYSYNYDSQRSKAAKIIKDKETEDCYVSNLSEWDSYKYDDKIEYRDKNGAYKGCAYINDDTVEFRDENGFYKGYGYIDDDNMEFRDENGSYKGYAYMDDYTIEYHDENGGYKGYSYVRD